MAQRRTKQTKVTVDRLEDTPKFDHNNRCMACGTHCKSRRSQLAHAIGQHLSDATPENRALKWPFICAYCGKGFPQDATLRCHINAKHTGKKPYHCEFPPCTEAAAYQSSMYRHMEAKHNWLPKNPRKERVGNAKNRKPEDAQENANGQDSASREAEEADAGRAGPTRTARPTRRAAPYFKPASQKAAHNVLNKPAPIVPNIPLPTKTASFAGVQETPRLIHLTHGAQPVQQKDFYYETHPSQYRGYYTNPYQQGYYDNAAATASYLPAPSEYVPAPAHNPPAPTYNSTAPVCNQPMPIYPPGAYGAGYNNHDAAYNGIHPSNTNHASSSGSNYASASSSSFYSTTSSDSFHTSSPSNSFYTTSSTAPQLSASDIKFAGFSFSSTNTAHTVLYPATSDSSYAAQVNGSSPHQANVLSPLDVSVPSALDASVWSALDNTPLSSQESLLPVSQDSFMDLSEHFLDFSQGSFMDPSQHFLFDFSQNALLDLTLANAGAPCNAAAESDAPDNSSPEPAAPCSPYAQVFDEFINADALS
ncbi:uncharacterized protein SCHCODRAFT_02618100 [Schizophyllum commune H4-8]|uniref:C2H2-type domain-containing protein n=1 Tax=Schizophyllum commune (strain H4-8 / FGSC 9210) TaxID=578458 RepID=D8Q3J4_SCHCM|nr:uncharacterized protein SCHCODRAFT_02618100 [Schizophyllum commune H4-8]KAI5894923.1 hypothetical protein SCHCODRAFT_02618100 [Schizophyllum commune H4-8]